MTVAMLGRPRRRRRASGTTCGASRRAKLTPIDADDRTRPVERRAVPRCRSRDRRACCDPRLAGALDPARRDAAGAARCSSARSRRLDDDGSGRRRAATGSPAPTSTCGDAGELTPVLAAIAALADSPSRLIGIDYLRGHETDRLAALDPRAERPRCGGRGARATAWRSRPKPLHGSVFSTYDDHRLAMAGAVIGLVVSGVVRSRTSTTTAKTFPGFARARGPQLVDGQGADS